MGQDRLRLGYENYSFMKDSIKLYMRISYIAFVFVKLEKNYLTKEIKHENC